MKCILAVLVLAAAASATMVTMDDFRSWARAHNKQYTSNEVAHRFGVFQENIAAIDSMNAENFGTVHFAPNKFSDLTNSEFKALYTTTMTGKPRAVVVPDHSADDVNDAEVNLTDSFPPVKNQGACGSCWAFSAVASMEHQVFKASKKVTSLSEQQLVSCDVYGNNGCNGGNMMLAFLYAKEVGMESEGKWPYSSGKGEVEKCKEHGIVSNFGQYSAIDTTDKAMMDALKEKGALSIAIQADKAIFQHYAGGVIEGTSCGTATNHGVTLIGYGTQNGKNYWIVRNSWGSDWGVEGYVLIGRGNNVCGINTQVSVAGPATVV